MLLLLELSMKNPLKLLFKMKNLLKKLLNQQLTIDLFTFVLIGFYLVVVLYCCSSCSVLALSAGKAANTITQTTHTTTTTRIDSVSVLPNYKHTNNFSK